MARFCTVLLALAWVGANNLALHTEALLFKKTSTTTKLTSTTASTSTSASNSTTTGYTTTRGATKSTGSSTTRAISTTTRSSTSIDTSTTETTYTTTGRNVIDARCVPYIVYLCYTLKLSGTPLWCQCSMCGDLQRNSSRGFTHKFYIGTKIRNRKC